VSGFVRTAELLTRDGLKAYDGAGCRAVPILSGILPDGTHLQPLRHRKRLPKAAAVYLISFLAAEASPSGRGRRGR
jgi:hypothetical protein